MSSVPCAPGSKRFKRNRVWPLNEANMARDIGELTKCNFSALSLAPLWPTAISTSTCQQRPPATEFAPRGVYCI
jgi:hypothetical protein